MRQHTWMLRIALAMLAAGLASSKPLAAQSSDTATGRPARARRAKARIDSIRAAHAAAPTYGGVKAPTYGNAKAPTYGSVKAPTYGSVKAPTYGSVAAPTYGSVKAPTYGSGVKTHTYGSVPMRQPRDTTTAAAPDKPAQGAAPSVASNPGGSAESAAEPTPTGWTARYYYVDAQNLLHTWDFVGDGTYLYREVYNGGSTSHGTSERGTYTISGGVLEVHVTRVTTASGTTVNGTTTMAAGETGPGQTRRYSFRMLGTQGKDGIVMDGITLKPKSW